MVKIKRYKGGGIDEFKNYLNELDRIISNIIEKLKKDYKFDTSAKIDTREIDTLYTEIYSNTRQINTLLEEQVGSIKKINKEIDNREIEGIKIFKEYLDNISRLYNQSRDKYSRSLTPNDIKEIEDNIEKDKDKLIEKYYELKEEDKDKVKKLIEQYKHDFKNSLNSEECIERFDFIKYFKYQDVYKLFSILRNLYAISQYKNDYSMYDVKGKSDDELERQIDDVLKSIKPNDNLKEIDDDLKEIIKQSINNIKNEKYIIIMKDNKEDITNLYTLKMRMNFKNYHDIKFAGSITNIIKIRRSKKY